MSSLNKVQIIGNLCRDVEMRHTQDGKPIANMSVATSESWKDQAGNKQEKSEFHRVVVFGSVAEVCNKYLSKGSKVFLEGKLQTRKWTDKDGRDVYTTEIVVDLKGRMLMLDGKNDNSSVANDTQSGYSENEEANEPDFEDEIPF